VKIGEIVSFLTTNGHQLTRIVEPFDKAQGGPGDSGVTKPSGDNHFDKLRDFIETNDNLFLKNSVSSVTSC
jgi:hypothetical protein